MARVAMNVKDTPSTVRSRSTSLSSRSAVVPAIQRETSCSAGSAASARACEDKSFSISCLLSASRRESALKGSVTAGAIDQVAGVSCGDCGSAVCNDVRVHVVLDT